MDKALIDQFKTLEPFRENIVRNPWEEGVIDVAEINKLPFESVINRLKSIKEKGDSQIFVLQGEPGSGKSHLLWRIAQNAEKEFFLFASFNPLIVNKELTYVSILQSVIESLLKKHSALKTKPIEHIIGQIIHTGLKDLNNSLLKTNPLIFDDIQDTKKRKLPYIYKEEFTNFSQTEKNKLIPLIVNNAFDKLYFKNYVPKKYLQGIIRGLINADTLKSTIDLLNGEKLSPQELKSLGLANGFVIDDNIACEILRALFILSPFPFLVSIDQIEHIDVKLPTDQILNFFEDIVTLSNNSFKVLFLLTVQTQTYQKWESFMPEHIKGRLNNKSTLFSINTDEALEIVQRRTVSAWERLGVRPESPFCPFTEDFAREKIKSMKLKAPRMVINTFDTLLNGEKTSEDSFASIFTQYSSKIHYKKDEMQRETSELILNLFYANTLKTTNTYNILSFGGNAYSINNSPRSYYYTAKNLSGFLKKKKISSALLVRDEVLKINENTETMKIIKGAGINLKYYSKDLGKELIVIAKMIKDSESGDLDINKTELNNFAIGKLKSLLEVNIDEVLSYKKTTSTEETKDSNTGNRAELKKSLEEKVVAELLLKMKNGMKIANLNKYLEEKKLVQLINEITEILQTKESVYVMKREDGIVWLSEKDY